MIRRLIVAITVATLVSFTSTTNAKITKQYFEALQNCEGGGGWLVVDDGENNGGVANIMVLCDGGTEGTP